MTNRILTPDLNLYFENVVGAFRVPLNALKPMRARPEGIKNARLLMEKAAVGEVPKRMPIEVRRRNGFWEIIDGNSTYAVATEEGWTEILCIECTEASED
ncbi:hypothetical protein ACVNHC_16345 [Pannonibacter sp. Q-1]